MMENVEGERQPRQWRRGDDVVLEIERAAFEGKNIAHIDGLVVFVHGGVPGDHVHARLTKIKKQFLEADVVSVEHPSPDRVPAPCRYFGVCGGCTWQDLAYSAQLEFKRQHVVDALERLGGFEGVDVQPTLGATRAYGYRNKMEFSFGDRWLTPAEMKQRMEAVQDEAMRSAFALGLHIPGRYDKVLDIEECHLQSEVSARIVNFTRRFALDRGLTIHSTDSHSGYLRNLVIRESKQTGDRMVNVVTFENRPEIMRDYCALLLDEVEGVTTVVNNITATKSQIAVGETENVYFGTGTITDTIGDRTYSISSNSFFQTNTEQATRLYDVVKRMADLRHSDIVFDLYCGTGTIALHLADRVKQVVGIESVPQAVADAKRNAESNGVRNCSFLAGDMKEHFARNGNPLQDHPAPDVIVVDPPRSGMHEAVTRALPVLGARRIIYVSCNPATQARDLKILTEHDRYTIREVQPVDMFPQTYHIENVVLLESNT